MTRKLYFAANGAVPTAAAQASVLTGTSIKTLLQISTPSTTGLTVIEWGISFVGTTSTDAPVKCELFQSTAACTGGTSVTPTLWGDPNAPASLCSAVWSPTEVDASGVRMFDVQHISPTSGYVKQFPLGREPEVAVSKYLRIRVTATVTVGAYAYVIWEE